LTPSRSCVANLGFSRLPFPSSGGQVFSFFWEFLNQGCPRFTILPPSFLPAGHRPDTCSFDSKILAVKDLFGFFFAFFVNRADMRRILSPHSALYLPFFFPCGVRLLHRKVPFASSLVSQIQHVDEHPLFVASRFYLSLPPPAPTAQGFSFFLRLRELDFSLSCTFWFLYASFPMSLFFFFFLFPTPSGGHLASLRGIRRLYVREFFFEVSQLDEALACFFLSSSLFSVLFQSSVTSLH